MQANRAAEPAGSGIEAPEPPAEAQPVAAAAVEPAVAAAPEPLAPAGSGIHVLFWRSGLPSVEALARRDAAALFTWPVTYLALAAVIVPTSILGYLLPAFAGQPVAMDGVFSWAAVATAVVVPLGTARLLARDQRSGMLALLLASPVRAWEVVAAKWIAGLLFFLAAIAFTAVHVALLLIYQGGLDSGAVLSGYLGILLVGAAWVALGLLAASLTSSQVLAAALGIAMLLTLQYVLGTAAGFLQPPLSDLLGYASAANRAQLLEQGQVALRDVVYFATVAGGALLLSAVAVAWRRTR